MSDQLPVLVTTEYRGVFFGYAAPSADLSATTLTLYRMRNCIYWSSDVKGFLGLAQDGPTESCRVGPAVEGPSILQKVTCVAEVTPEAAAAWEKGPWAE